MRPLALLTFQTLDGVMQAPMQPDEDPSGGFRCGGWASPFAEAVMAQVLEEVMKDRRDLLFGRKTYELFAGHWPQVGDDDPVARFLNHADKYVVTSSEEPLEWRGSTAIRGHLAESITRLKEQEGPPLQVHGSWQLIQALLAHGLVDELRLWTFPIVAGHGKRLFGPGTPALNLQHLDSRTTPQGVTMSYYRRSPS
ncbi:MAG: dihydrofolate reductase family protein [Acidobacteriota bacterium]